MHGLPTPHSSQQQAMAKLVYLLFLTAATLFLVSTPQARVRNDEDPEERLEQCLQDCRRDPSQLGQCVKDCKRQYEKEKEKQGGGEGEGWRRKNVAEAESTREEEGEKESDNPYFFGKENFRDRYRTEDGRFQVMDRFATKTDVLRGIESYRIGIFRANPLAYALPHHCDSEATFYIARGRGTIILLRENKQSYNVQEGDILVVKAGTNVLIANTDENEELYIVKLLDPAATPGEVEEYFVAGGQDPESILGGFSKELSQAALKISKRQLEKLAGKHKEGAVLKGSKEQMRALRSRAKSRGPWPFGEAKGPFNLLDQRPTHSNQYGQLFEADDRDYEDLATSDLSFAFINLTEGAMELPNYNTKSPRIAVVLRGKGFFEMVCPHLARERQRQKEEGQGKEEEGGGREEKERDEGRIRYERVRSDLSPNTVYVAPPGHPVITVASEGENLQILWIQLYARGNRRHYLAGGQSLLRRLEKEEAELSFRTPSEEVRRMVHAQNDEGFTKGPEQRENGGGRHRAVESIIGVMGF